LTIDNSHTQLFTLSRVDQHTFHGGFLGLPRVACRGGASMAACRGSRRNG